MVPCRPLPNCALAQIQATGDPRTCEVLAITQEPYFVECLERDHFLRQRRGSPSVDPPRVNRNGEADGSAHGVLFSLQNPDSEDMAFVTASVPDCAVKTLFVVHTPSSRFVLCSKTY